MIASPPHILCIDDDDKIRELLKVFLKKNNFRVSISKNAADAQKIVDLFIFDLLILDIMMPKTNGITFLKYFRKKNSRIPILMLTADGNLERKTESFTSGCDDYLIKPFEPFELVLRINKLLNPRINLKQTKKSFFGDCEFDFNSKELRKNNILINLTYSEQKLIELLSKNLNQEISREKIANELNLKSNFRSIDVIITRLRKKISFKNESLYLRTIRGKGNMLISDYD